MERKIRNSVLKGLLSALVIFNITLKIFFIQYFVYFSS